jgi:hypothetical protein
MAALFLLDAFVAQKGLTLIKFNAILNLMKVKLADLV